MFLFPKISQISFSHHVRGPGVFTPVEIQLSGWGLLSVSCISLPQFKPYRVFKFFGQKTLQIDVPKDQTIQITFWNVIGWSRKKVTVPANNTDVNAIYIPERPLIEVPGQASAWKIMSRTFSLAALPNTQLNLIRSTNANIKKPIAISAINQHRYHSAYSIETKRIRNTNAAHLTSYQLNIDSDKMHLGTYQPIANRKEEEHEPN